MSGKEFWKSVLMTYFMIVTLVNVANYVLGSLLNPGQQFGYEAFLVPLSFGFIGVIPEVIMYSKKELTVKQFWIRKVLHFISVLAIVFFIGYGVQNINEAPIEQTLMFGLSVVVIYVLVNVFMIILNTSEAKKLDKLLQDYKDSK